MFRTQLQQNIQCSPYHSANKMVQIFSNFYILIILIVNTSTVTPYVLALLIGADDKNN